jgi:hypothetical protein
MSHQEQLAQAGTIQGIFKTGLEFLYARCEQGPSLYAILEGAWLNAALIKGIRGKVWECDPTQPNPVAAAWANTGLMVVKTIEQGPEAGAVYCQLTDAGQRVVACTDLLEYEFSMMQQQLDNNFVTDPEKYRNLRGGLDNYATAFLPELRDWVSRGGDSVVPEGAAMFDMCGGSGHHLKAFLERNPTTAGLLYDRAPDESWIDQWRSTARAGDVFADNEFFAAHAGQYDFVLLSEILHCKGLEERAFLMRRAKSLLKPGGSLLVIEQFPGLRLEWRMRDMTEGGQCLLEAQVASEAQDCGFMGVAGIHCLSHYGIRFEQFEG